MDLFIIAAMGFNRVIGSKGQIPWKDSTDMQRFKKLTTGYPIIMGRKTFESIGKTLPGRYNLVISSQTAQPATFDSKMGRWVKSPAEAVVAAMEYDLAKGCEHAFVIGGEQIYKRFLPFSRRIYLSVFPQSPEGVAFFPQFDLSNWKLSFVDNCETHRFELYERVDVPT